MNVPDGATLPYSYCLCATDLVNWYFDKTHWLVNWSTHNSHSINVLLAAATVQEQARLFRFNSPHIYETISLIWEQKPKLAILMKNGLCLDVPKRN